MLTAQQVFDYYDNFSRKRALTLPESLALERAIKELDNIGNVRTRAWTESDDRLLRQYKKEGLTYGIIAKRLKRTISAVNTRWQKINRQGRTGTPLEFATVGD